MIRDMSKRDTAKYKSKKYFIRKSSSTKLSLEINLKGFLCSCNNREKDCIKESYNLLNEYADKLYKEPSESVEDETLTEEDISDQLSKEISGLKEDSKPNRKRFQAIDSGAKNFLFIRANIESPVELAETIIKDISESSNQKTKFLLRLVPVEITCKANMLDIGNAFVEIAQKHFKDSAQTFCVMFNHRNNNCISRDETIKLLADKVFEMRSDHKVDLKAAKLSIIVEVIKGFAFLSVIPDYVKHKKYNLLSLCNREQKDDD